MSYITAERLGRVLIWAWNKYVEETAISYKKLTFIIQLGLSLTGLVFFGLCWSMTLLYLHFGEHNSIDYMSKRIKKTDNYFEQ